VDYFRCIADDGFEIQGLLSSPLTATTILLHVHGFGGDFIANKFVQQMHKALPDAGIAFASFNHRLSGYIVERYGERDVLYSGAALSDASLCAFDLAAVANCFKPRFGTVVIQGHSFGTNIVKNFARTTNWTGDLVFLSASDSLWLYNEWLTRHDDTAQSLQCQLKMAAEKFAVFDDAVALGLFGIDLGSNSYAIPMSRRALESLLSSEVFDEWSTSAAVCPNRSIAISGDSDPISGGGRTGSFSKMMEWMPCATIVRIAGAGHLFAGKEQQLIGELLGWLKG
jgi:alpha/beta superfamily hydrolase